VRLRGAQDIAPQRGGTAPTAAACCAKCAAAQGCGAFTWHGAAGSPPHGCYLKADCKGASRGTNAVRAPAAAPPVGLYPIVTFQYSSTTLYQISDHIQYLFF
jgi:hypothetical protein